MENPLTKRPDKKGADHRSAPKTDIKETKGSSIPILGIFSLFII